MGKFRFERWGNATDPWLGGMSSWAASNGDGLRFVATKIFVGGESQTAGGPTALQPLSQDDIQAAPPSSGVTTLGADTPVIWLLPRDDSPVSLFTPGESGGAESSAAAGFITASGDHVDSVSTQPSLFQTGSLFLDDDHFVLGAGIDRIVPVDGFDFNLTAADGDVGAGHTLTVSGQALSAGHHLSFDGSAETSGRFMLQGGADDDTLIGGHGADALEGGTGADTLTGGGGADSFLYQSAADSTGARHDTILDFTFGEDVIDLPVSVQGLDAAVTKGGLSEGSFDADLAAALGGGVLEAGHALFFTPDSGALAGHHFLVVDANGEAGYQAGADFVIELPSLPPADFHGTGFLV